MQMRSSWVWPHKTSAHQRRYHMRAVGASGYGAYTVRRTHADVVKEVRPQKHTCVCSEGRTVMCLTVLMQIEVRTPPTTPP